MGLFDMVDSFLNPQKGYQKGQQELDKYFNQGQSYLNPYNQFGKDAYGNLSESMRRLLDPASLQADWIKSYTESPSAKNATDLATQSGLDAASSMGLMGSNTALNALQGGASKIALNDRQNFLDNLMQKYLAGTGIAGNIFNTGANAANTLSNNAMNMGNNSAQMAFGEQNSPGDLFAKLLGTGVGYLSGRAGGGDMNGADMPPYARNAIASSGGWSVGG